jgi:hypothetical protein
MYWLCSQDSRVSQECNQHEASSVTIHPGVDQESLEPPKLSFWMRIFWNFFCYFLIFFSFGMAASSPNRPTTWLWVRHCLRLLTFISLRILRRWRQCLVKHMTHNFSKRAYTVAIFLLLPKAYGTDWTAGPINKLLRNGTQDSMLLLFLSYLTGRKIRSKWKYIFQNGNQYMQMSSKALCRPHFCIVYM